MRVLVVDDDPDVRYVLERALQRDGHAVATAVDLASARAALEASDTDVIVLDLGLPDGSGVDLCRALRAERETVPVLVVTARSEVARRVEALDAGADDFLAKPFAIAELRARVRALGRRRVVPLVTSVVTLGAVVLDLSARRATREGKVVPMSPREWAILESLTARAGRVVSRFAMIEEIWGDRDEAHGASLEVLIARIRRKLGDDLIRTARGEGYAMGRE